MKTANFIIIFLFSILLAACTKSEEFEWSKYCRTAFEQTKKCPEYKCKIGCGPVSIFDRGGCPAACNPKSCSEFNSENCPLEICQIMTNCKGDKVCHFKFIGNPPKCGKEGYYGQDVACCEGLTKRCDFINNDFPVCGISSTSNEEFVYTDTSNLTKPTQLVEKTPQELCENGGGSWKEFPNDGAFCHDECNKPGNVRCLRFMSMDCDCGIDKCWNGNSCISGQ